MSKQLIGIGTAANDGTGDTLRAAFTKANANANELYGAIEQIGYRRPPILGFAGDSIAGQMGDPIDLNTGAIAYALMALTKRDFLIDNTAAATDGSGGYNFGIGGSPSSYLVTNYLSNGNALAKLQAKAVKPDIVFVQSMQNDAMNASRAVVEGYVQNYRDYCAGALAAGVGLIVILPRPPKNAEAGATNPPNHQHVNMLLRQYADATNGVMFLDYLPLVKDINDAAENNGASSFVGWRGSAVTGAYTADGTHPSTLSTRAYAPLFVPILDQFGRSVEPRASGFTDWDNTNYQYNNILQRNGMMVGTNGQRNFVNNTSVAGASPTNYWTYWSLNDGNGITATPSIITHADGYKRQRLTLSGTASAAASVVLQLGFVDDFTSGLIDHEALLDFNAVTGLQDWSMQVLGTPAISQNVSQIATLNDKLFLRNLRPRTFVNSGYANKATALTLNIASGSTVSGSVDLGRVGAWKI